MVMGSAASRHRYTFRDYLDVEEMSAVKHEYLDGDIFAMAGGISEHAALCAALVAHLVNLTRDTPCRAYTSDLRVRVLETGLATYPDAALVCGPLERDPESATHVCNPAVIFEVLSPGTEDYDRGEKREHYQQIESLRSYVVLAQDRRHAEMWQRQAGGGWSHEVFEAGQSLPIIPIAGTLSIDELYAEAGLAVP